MTQPTKDEICNFVTKACTTTTNEKFYLCTVDLETALKIKKTIPLTLTNYQVIITERYVRHVRNGHHNDLDFICLIPEIIKSFDSIHKTTEQNRRTKKIEICVIFEKKYDNDTVKLVKLRDIFKKSLLLKTIFRKD